MLLPIFPRPISPISKPASAVMGSSVVVSPSSSGVSCRTYAGSARQAHWHQEIPVVVTGGRIGFFPAAQYSGLRRRGEVDAGGVGVDSIQAIKQVRRVERDREF